jgi:hypothetical protein
MAYFHQHLSPITWWPAAFLALAVIGGPAARDVARRTCVPRLKPDRELVAA